MEDNNGFRVIVGKDKGSGLFEYFLGSKQDALKLGNQMKDTVIHSFNVEGKIYIDIQPCFLRVCKCCQKLTEEYICLKCEDLLSDARIEMAYEREALENEY